MFSRFNTIPTCVRQTTDGRTDRHMTTATCNTGATLSGVASHMPVTLTQPLATLVELFVS